MPVVKPLAIAVVVGLLSASPVTAESWPICFEENRSPTPSTYAAFREATALFNATERFRARVIIWSRDADDAGEGFLSSAMSTAYLEAVRAGLSPSYILTETNPRLEAPPDCLSLEVEITAPPARPHPPLLWHMRAAYFSSGSAEISDAGRYWVRLAAALNRPGQTLYRLDGHSDTQGPQDGNLDLSRRRTIAVAEALVREGVGWVDIEMSYFGETRLARPTADGVDEPLNRRVWIDMRQRRATPH